MSVEMFHTQQRKTQALKKYLNYINSLGNNQEVIKELKWFRAFFSHKKTGKPFPENGLPTPKTYKLHLKNVENYSLPEKQSERDVFWEKHDNFTKKYQTEFFSVTQELLVFYNTADSLKHFGDGYLGGVMDLNQYLSFNETPPREDIRNYYRSIYNNTGSTPIAILVHPYMSERDIVDFVKKIYRTNIKPLQEKYTSKDITLEKTRGKSKILMERNDFIYKNRELPILSLTRKVNEKYNKTYSYTYVQTLLKKEKLKII